MAFVPNSIITLTTDFGLDDPFAAIMKGVILSVNPKARIVDITHGVPAHDILAGAMALQSSCSHFPKGTIHLAVVDPGVGSSRRPLLAVCDHHAFVGPDNGLLSPSMQSQKGVQVIHLTQEAFFVKPVSQTFHGRDIFAPVAAWLSLGKLPESFGPVIDDWIRLDWPVPRRVGESLFGTVLRVDRFGNLITNIDRKTFERAAGEGLTISVGAEHISRVVSTYADVALGEICALFGSSDHLEIAASGSSAANRLSVDRGAAVRVSRVT